MSFFLCTVIKLILTIYLIFLFKIILRFAFMLFFSLNCVSSPLLSFLFLWIALLLLKFKNKQGDAVFPSLCNLITLLQLSLTDQEGVPLQRINANPWTNQT